MSGRKPKGIYKNGATIMIVQPNSGQIWQMTWSPTVEAMCKKVKSWFHDAETENTETAKKTGNDYGEVYAMIEHGDDYTGELLFKGDCSFEESKSFIRKLYKKSI